jgi:hypothetical protein
MITIALRKLRAIFFEFQKLFIEFQIKPIAYSFIEIIAINAQ